jgi:site-specific DNA-cytosine methylase
MELKRLTYDHEHNAVAAYVFAGGMSVGMGQHFNVLAHLEDGPYGSKTVKRNLPEVELHDVPREWPTGHFKRKATRLLYANPPCAVWSALGKSAQNKTDWRGDERLHCWTRAVDAGIGVGADIIAIESVPAVYTRGFEFLASMVQVVVEEGYAVTIVRHDGKLMGLPQQRRRVMFIAHKVRLTVPAAVEPLVTVKQALAGLDEAGPLVKTPPEIARLLPMVADGTYKGVRQAFFVEYDDALIKSDKLRKPCVLDRVTYPDQPANTIARASLYHWAEERHLGYYEYKRLCGYPDWFTWELPQHQGYVVQEMVRAVLPPVAQWFGALFEEALTNNDKLNVPTVTRVDIWPRTNRMADVTPEMTVTNIAGEVGL